MLASLQDAKERATELTTITSLLTESLNSTSKDLIKAHLKTIVRFSAEVPYDDVVEAFQALIKQIEAVRYDSLLL